jgi:hypothetical protein
VVHKNEMIFVVNNNNLIYKQLYPRVNKKKKKKFGFSYFIPENIKKILKNS